MTANREAWLIDATRQVRPLFEKIDIELPGRILVSCGWPSTGGLRARRRVVGECWASHAAGGVNQVFINPTLADPIDVLDTLVHELIHVSDDGVSKHRGHFARTAKKIGLERPWTASTAGPELLEHLKRIAAKLGEYPHAAIDAQQLRKPQATRMIKIVCAVEPLQIEYQGKEYNEPYALRTTRMWIEYGLPKCPCHDVEMIERILE